MPPLSQEVINILKWRTRNIFIDPFYILFWDLWPRFTKRTVGQVSVSRPKAQNDLIPLTMLTYNRPLYFKETLSSFVEKNISVLEYFPIIINVQGENTDKITSETIEKYKKFIYKVIYPKVNLGCAAGYSLLMAEAARLNPSYIVHLQDDFVSIEPLSKYISEILEFFNDYDVGFIRLRSTKDRVNDYNIISRRKIRYKKIVRNVGVSNGHFTFNPTISKTSVIEKLIPTTSEKDAQKKYQKMGIESGQLFANCFSHIGHERVKNWLK